MTTELEPTQPPPPRPGSVPDSAPGSLPTATPHGPSSVQKPWWGLGDVLLAVVIIFSVSTAVVVPFLLYAELQSLDLPIVGFDGSDTFSDATSSGIPAVALIAGLWAQQLAMGAWPMWVAKFKGFGAKQDFGLSFRPIDLVYGFFGGLGLIVLAALVGAAASALVGLDDPNEASNTDLLTENRGSPLLYLVVFAVVVGAPLSEEIFFRGLLMRAVEKRWNVWLAVLFSTVIFTAVHYTGSSLAGTAVLFASIATLGAGLALLAVGTTRLGAPIIAHMTINGTAVVAGLWA